MMNHTFFVFIFALNILQEHQGVLANILSLNMTQSSLCHSVMIEKFDVSCLSSCVTINRTKTEFFFCCLTQFDRYLSKTLITFQSESPV